MAQISIYRTCVDFCGSHSNILPRTDRFEAMEKTSMNKKAQNVEGLTSWLRDFPPADYILKIDSFSLFLDTKVEMYDSRVFEAGGYKWKLCLCPHGNKKVNVNDHVSLYLKLVDTQGLPQGWEVMATFKFFVFDHICGKFLTFQDGEEFKRFNEFKSVWGFDRFLPIDTLKDTTKGYLQDESCLFGVEIYVLGRSHKGECISTVKNPEKGTYSWNIRNFSDKKTNPIYSDEFVVADQKWKLQCYPGGYSTAKGSHMSLFLYLCGSNSNSSPAEDKVYADFKLRIKEQMHGKNHEMIASSWFTSKKSWGYFDFLSLKDLNDKSKGYIVNNNVILEAQITQISVLKDF